MTAGIWPTATFGFAILFTRWTEYTEGSPQASSRQQPLSRTRRTGSSSRGDVWIAGTPRKLTESHARPRTRVRATETSRTTEEDTEEAVEAMEAATPEGKVAKGK
jgi:hypothetical protein